VLAKGARTQTRPTLRTQTEHSRVLLVETQPEAFSIELAQSH